MLVRIFRVRAIPPSRIVYPSSAIYKVVSGQLSIDYGRNVRKVDSGNNLQETLPESTFLGYFCHHRTQVDLTSPKTSALTTILAISDFRVSI